MSGKYGGLLPDASNEYFRDFIADENIKYGPIIDVNTYEYPLLGYFSLIRQQFRFLLLTLDQKTTKQPTGQSETFQRAEILTTKARRSRFLQLIEAAY